MAVAEPQVIRPEVIDDTLCQRCDEEPVTHRAAVSPLDPTVERPDRGPSWFVVMRLGDRCVRDLVEQWWPQ